MNTIAIGQYIPGESAIHKLDPRAKLIITVLYIAQVFYCSILGYLLSAVYILMVCSLAGLKPRQLIRSLKPMWMLIAMTSFLNLFFTRAGDVMFEFYFIRITSDGFNLAVFFALRLMFLVAGTTLMTLTTSPIELTDALERFMKPLAKIRFPAHELSMMMSIALRFIPTLTEETDKIMKAQASRGADFETGSLMKRAKALTPILAPLFISAFRRAGDLAMAMESRCYQGGEGRTRMNRLRYGVNDLYAVLFVVCLIALTLLLKYI